MTFSKNVFASSQTASANRWEFVKALVAELHLRLDSRVAPRASPDRQGLPLQAPVAAAVLAQAVDAGAEDASLEERAAHSETAANETAGAPDINPTSRPSPTSARTA